MFLDCMITVHTTCKKEAMLSSGCHTKLEIKKRQRSESELKEADSTKSDTNPDEMSVK